MNTEKHLEEVLRAAPQFEAPPGLKQRLIDDIRLPAGVGHVGSSRVRRGAAGWIRRRWPAFAPAGVSMACAVGFTVQQLEINELQQDLESLSHALSASSAVLPAAGTPPPAVEPAGTQDEFERLQQKVRQLSAEIAELEGLGTQNAQLRARLVTARAPTGLTAEEAEALQNARQKAMFIQCINNLKQLGLAARVWAVDHSDACPPNVLSMSNEVATPKILVCPADTSRTAASDWSSFTSANSSYDYLGTDSPGYQESFRVLFRCPIHGSIGLLDGSVQGGVGRDHPEQLVQRDGKLYFEPGK